jgi:hypothetical protein
MTPCALGRNFLSQPGGIVRQMLPRSRNMMGGTGGRAARVCRVDRNQGRSASGFPTTAKRKRP